MSEELKPCPFCGSKDVRFTNHGQKWGNGLHRGDIIWSMGCYQCGASVPGRYNDHGRKLMVADWNRRANDEPTP